MALHSVCDADALFPKPGQPGLIIRKRHARHAIKGSRVYHPGHDHGIYRPAFVCLSGGLYGGLYLLLLLPSGAQGQVLYGENIGLEELEFL